jgi:hypothetical protein
MKKYVIYEEYGTIRAGAVEKDTKKQYKLSGIDGCLRSFSTTIGKHLVKAETTDCQKVIRVMYTISLLSNVHEEVVEASEKSYERAIEEVLALMARGAGMKMANVAPPYSEIVHLPGPSSNREFS